MPTLRFDCLLHVVCVPTSTPFLPRGNYHRACPCPMVSLHKTAGSMSTLPRKNAGTRMFLDRREAPHFEPDIRLPLNKQGPAMPRRGVVYFGCPRRFLRVSLVILIRWSPSSLPPKGSVPSTRNVFRRPSSHMFYGRAGSQPFRSQVSRREDFTPFLRF